jgi:cell division protein FtsA
MLGVRLEAEVHIITGSVTCAQNIVKCVNRAGFKVKDLVLQTLAAGAATLSKEDKELGTALIDLGGGTTEVMVYSQGAPYSTATIPVGGLQVTNDIAVVKNISNDAAEKIKIEAGCCWDDLLEGDDEIIIPAAGGRPPLSIPRSQVMRIIRPRMEEIFLLVKEKLDKLPLARPLGGGIVITGGGAQLLGAAELASHIFKLPVRIGIPVSVGGLVEEYRNPAFATAVGLVLEGNERELTFSGERPKEVFTEKSQASAFARFLEWIKDFF